MTHFARMLAHQIDHTTASAGPSSRRRRESHAFTIALWAVVAAAVVFTVIF